MSDNTYDVTFVDELPASRSSYTEFYEALRDNPGKWAKYPGRPPSAYGYARDNPGFEATSRGTPPDQVAYMRYVGKAV